MATLIGVDEAGRGALAGPVVAAAVSLSDDVDKSLFMDSKQLTAARRDYLFDVLKASNSQIGVSILSHHFIDRVNILNATFEAMSRAVLQICDASDVIEIDGNKIPSQLIHLNTRAIIGGDRKVSEISAASIIAKVTRDRIMERLATKFPEYGFDVHKGYGTRFHYDAVFNHGRSLVHRRSFKIVRQGTLFE